MSAEKTETKELEKIEVEVPVILTSCAIHRLVFKECTVCNEKICTVCILNSKEKIQHYKEHFDSIQDVQVERTNYLAKINDYEGFELLNKSYKTYLSKVQITVENTNQNMLANIQKFNKYAKELLLRLYLELTEKFEETVKKVNSKISVLDINDQSSKEEFKILKKSMDDQTEFLDSSENLKQIFEKIITGCNNKYNRIKVTELAREKFELKLGKRGECLDMIGCNGPLIETLNTRGGIYYVTRSEESFKGEFTAKLKVIKIDSGKASNYWGFAFGICRVTSTNNDNYYNDSILFQANGYLANKFSGSSSFKKLFSTGWVNGDEIIISRDSKNNISFGVNNEKDMRLAFENITGEFKIVFGCTSSSNGDKFELVEIV